MQPGNEKRNINRHTIRDSFEEGFARLTYKSPGVYDLAYFRPAGKWFTVFYDLPLNDCFEQVKSDPIFAARFTVIL